MMKLFQTRDEQKKSLTDYERRIFPYGESQREAESNLLAELLPKMRKEQRMYCLVTLRDVYTSGYSEEKLQTKIINWYGDCIKQRVTPEHCSLILAGERLEQESGYAEIPDPAAVQTYAERIWMEEMIQWPKNQCSGISLKRLLFGED